MNNLSIILISEMFIYVVLLIFLLKNIYKIHKNKDYKRLKVYDKYKVITLCGSTKFKKEFEEVQKELTLRGHIVISVGCFGHSGDMEVWDKNNKEMLDKIHKRKIDLSDAIMVINKDNYIGESTNSEIKYAKSTNKQVYYWYKY